jgi:hypothetical protein
MTACTFNAGNTPDAVAFDGANIWVTNSFNNTVSKLRASDGACAGTVNPADMTACTFNAGNTPDAVAFDGANIWVVNNNPGGSVGSVSKL